MWKIIREISVHSYQYEQIHANTFNRPHYVKVQKYFDTLHVDLKDESCQKMSFQFGTSSITLNFKHKP